MQETSEAMARFAATFLLLILIPKLGIRGQMRLANGRKAWSLCDDDDNVAPTSTASQTLIDTTDTQKLH